MCTRYLLEQHRLRALIAALGLPPGAVEALAPTDRYNIAPGTPVAALRSLSGLFRPRWGFRPASAAFDSAPLLNARAETLALKPTFREAFRRRRCLVPASGFYEWEKRGRARLPWLFRIHAEGEPAAFCFAALWEPTPGDSPTLSAVVIVTTPPNALMAPLHHRMPALLSTAAACRAWLDPQTAEADLAALLAPADPAAMTATPVSPRVNRGEHDAPDCIAPAVHGIAARDGDEDGGPELSLPGS